MPNLQTTVAYATVADWYDYDEIYCHHHRQTKPYMYTCQKF